MPFTPIHMGPGLLVEPIGSVMHADLQPFAPWMAANPSLGATSSDGLHWCCLGAGLAGMLRYPLTRGCARCHRLRA